MPTKYEVLKDLEVTDQADPLFGTHVAGSVVECTSSESVLGYVEQGFLKAVDAVEDTVEGDQDDNAPEKPTPPIEEPPVAPAPVTPPPTVAHPDSVSLASKFPAPSAPFSECPPMLFAFCQAIEKHELWLAPGENPQYPNGTRSFHDKNPGNLKFVGQAGAIGEDKDGFVIFPDYETGFNALIRQVEIAIKNGGRRYPAEVFDPIVKAWRQQNFLDFFKVYDSSNGDNPLAYAERVAEYLSGIAGVTIPITTPMVTLIAA